ncbi:MAG TPA: nucleotide sugar dehydrogenase, partial [Acidobacteriota bacterium]|nr:nucleotide sugar dehydrogenase [Acidobacteriota bacterium]
DNDPERVELLKNSKSYILDVSTETLQAITSRFAAHADYDALHHADVMIICVPTPLRKTKDPDLSFILAATTEIANFIEPGKLIILESTTYPGTTEEMILPELQAGGLKAGTDFFLAYSPERIDPGNTQFRLFNTPKIVGGLTPQCGQLAELLYSSICEKVIRVSNTKAAEMVKLLENTFRAINIGMVNEIAIMCDKLGIDTWEVIEAAATKPFGYMPFYPGPGLGGHCIPVDPHYLAWKLKTLNYSARFIELAGEINSQMPGYIVSKITEALNEQNKSVKGSSILVLGVAYKKDSNDLRESPALDILDMLLRKGADVAYNDPYVNKLRLDSTTLVSTSFDAALLQRSDCVVIITDHSHYDWQFVVDHAPLLVDTRNATRRVHSENCRVVKL